MANLKSQDFDKNMILPDVPCGHSAFGTLSETCFQYVVFKVNVRRHTLTKIGKYVKFDTKIKHRIITRYYFGSISPFCFCYVEIARYAPDFK